MAKALADKIKIGDCFMKIGEPHGKVWKVIELKIAVDGILHARLKDGGAQGSSMTIAAGVLVDTRFWRAVPTAA